MFVEWMDFVSIMDGILMLFGSVNVIIFDFSIVWFVCCIDMVIVGWNLVMGVYYCFLVYVLNKYGLDIWFWICIWLESMLWWMNLLVDYGGIVGSVDGERKLL